MTRCVLPMPPLANSGSGMDRDSKSTGGCECTRLSTPSFEPMDSQSHGLVWVERDPKDGPGDPTEVWDSLAMPVPKAHPRLIPPGYG